MKIKYLLLSIILASISFTHAKTSNAQGVLYLNPIDSLLSNNNNSPFFTVGDIESINENQIVISDKLIYKLYMIDDLQEVPFKSGARGEGPGEFKVSPSKIAFDKTLQKIAVLDNTTLKINIFDAELNFVKHIINKLPPSDITYDDNGNLILGVSASNKFDGIYIYDEKGLRSSFSIDIDYINLVFDSYLVGFLENSNRIVIVFKNRNLIQFYSMDGSLINETKIEGLPDLSEFNEARNGNTRFKLPTSNMFKSIAVDKDKIFILGDKYSLYPHKTIYVISDEGQLIEKLIVEQPINIIEVSNKYLYTVNSKSLNKYTLISDD